MVTSQKTLETLVERLRGAEKSVDEIKAVKDALYAFYDDYNSHPYDLRKRALSLGKKASFGMIKGGIQQYENATAAMALAEDTMNAFKSLADQGQANLLLPKMAGHLEDMMAVLKAIKQSVNVVVDKNALDEEELDNIVNAINKVFFEAGVIRDKVATMQS